MSEPLLEVADMTVSYGGLEPVLYNIDLAVQPGEAVGVIGMNGAGKSTMLKAISGLLRPRSGAIRFEGEDVLRQSCAHRARRGIVMLAEGHRVIRPLTVRQNLETAANTLLPTRLRKRLDEILPVIHEMFPILEQRSKQPAGLLSGGEQQMLSISRALVQQPRLLLLDEPSLGLAPLIIDRIYNSFAALRERGISLLVVEQNSDRVAKACSRLLVLRDGRVVDSLDSEVLDADRLHAAYFGSTQPPSGLTNDLDLPAKERHTFQP
jgi:branched-chain amino acid transport system ATP-binding protein